MRIAIVGAGLNGLAVALLLRRAGFDCTLFERGAVPRDAGTGIYLWPQGVRVLRGLLPAAALHRYGHPIDFLDTHDRSGRVINRQHVRIADADATVPAMMFLRADLHRMLGAALGRDAIRFDAPCERVDEIDGQAVLTFESGARQRFDLVIGTDGLHSVVRRHVCPHNRPVCVGLAASRGIVRFDSPRFSADRCQIFMADYARVVTYCVNEAESVRYWFAAYQVDDGPLLDRNGLLDRFRTLPDAVREMIAATADTAINTQRLHTLSGAGPWHRGGAVLLGDSIHAMLPTLGYGFTLGLENGFLLAQALAGARAAGTHAALMLYERQVAARSQALIEVMNDMTRAYYFNAPDTVTAERIGRIAERFNALTCSPVALHEDAMAAPPGVHPLTGDE
ncbi:FAD-dependent monooxygenase [Burkholderia ubonensis]|nr:FAD-dependent monooxygenase [Burkholderia ubonensis]